MKTREVLSMPEAKLAQELKLMKIKELNRHAEEILLKFCVIDYKEVISGVIKILPQSDAGITDRFERVQAMIAEKIPDSHRQAAADEGALARIAIIIVVLITKQFQKIHQ